MTWMALIYFLQLNEIKKNIRKFNGFDFDKDSAEYKKKEGVLKGFVLIFSSVL